MTYVRIPMDTARIVLGLAITTKGGVTGTDRAHLEAMALAINLMTPGVDPEPTEHPSRSPETIERVVRADVGPCAPRRVPDPTDPAEDDTHYEVATVDEPEDDPTTADDLGPWTYAFPLDGRDPRLVTSEDDPAWADECNMATVTRKVTQNEGSGSWVDAFEVELIGSYEVLSMTITCGLPDAAADVYRHLLLAAHAYQG